MNGYTADLKGRIDTSILTPQEIIERRLADDKFEKFQYGGQTGVNILKDINLKYMGSNPFMNGYYFTFIQSGTWVNYFNDSQSELKKINLRTPDLMRIQQRSGRYIFNTDLPNILLETEVVSGRLRNLNYATKMQINSDFSINFHDNNNLDMLNYHVAHFKFIEALRRGDIKLSDNDKIEAPNSTFMYTPYYNAIWVLIFKPFSVKPIAIFKMMGVTPINLPLQSLMGDRGSPTFGTFNQTYKCNDVIFDFAGNLLDTEEKLKNFSYKASTTQSKELSTYEQLIDEFSKVYDGNSNQ